MCCKKYVVLAVVGITIDKRILKHVAYIRTRARPPTCRLAPSLPFLYIYSHASDQNPTSTWSKWFIKLIALNPWSYIVSNFKRNQLFFHIFVRIPVKMLNLTLYFVIWKSNMLAIFNKVSINWFACRSFFVNSPINAKSTHIFLKRG